MNNYFMNTSLLQNTLLPYFYDEEPVKSINKKFYNLNYEKYLTHIQPHGIIETHHKYRNRTIKNYINGKLNGSYEEWYKNGQLKLRETYKNDKLSGLSEIFYENGDLHQRTNYKNGKLDGLYKAWYENGCLHTKCYYKDGNYEGLYEIYYENGRLYQKKNYKMENFMVCMKNGFQMEG